MMPSFMPNTEGKAKMPRTSAIPFCFSASTFATRNMPPDLIAAFGRVSNRRKTQNKHTQNALNINANVEQHVGYGAVSSTVPQIHQIPLFVEWPLFVGAHYNTTTHKAPHKADHKARIRQTPHLILITTLIIVVRGHHN